MAKTLEQILGGQPNNYNPNLQVQQTPVQQPVANQQATTEQKPMSYADLFVATNPYRPQTAEEKEAERKRNRRNAVFAAIGDGISALSNLYFTTKGAPNAYTGGSTLSGKLYERQEQLRKERQALDQQYFNAYMNALKMDADEEYKNQNLRMQLKNLAHNWDMQAKKEAREAELQPYKVRYEESRARTQEAAANNAGNMEAAKLAVQESLKRQHDASAASSYARAENYKNGGSGSKSGSTKYEDKRFGGELFRLPVGYLKDDSNVSELFSMLPPDVRYEALGQWNKGKGLYDPRMKAKKLSTSEKLDVIRANMTPEIKAELRRNSDTNYVEKTSANQSTSLLPGAKPTLLP